MIKIIIADDHPIVRAGMKQIISEASEMKVADEAGDGRQLLHKIRTENFDVVILDITMPHIDGLDVLKQLKVEKPNYFVHPPRGSIRPARIKSGGFGLCHQDKRSG
jgi:two-component system invasion response regulator UvrY